MTRSSNICDQHGRKIRPGDIVRIFHYTDAHTRRRVYMYKLVVLCGDDLDVSRDGTFLYCVDIIDIWRNGLDHAHKCRLTDDLASEIEIVDGPMYNDDAWYERPRTGPMTGPSVLLIGE